MKLIDYVKNKFTSKEKSSSYATVEDVERIVQKAIKNEVEKLSTDSADNEEIKTEKQNELVLEIDRPDTIYIDSAHIITMMDAIKKNPHHIICKDTKLKKIMFGGNVLWEDEIGTSAGISIYSGNNKII